MRIIVVAFLLCVASVILCVGGVVAAAQMPLSVLPGGAVVYKPIQSIRERKFADLVPVSYTHLTLPTTPYV